MRKLTLLLAFSLLFAACSGPKKVVNADNHTETILVKDGSSFEKAIVITEQHEIAGIHAEYAWIREHYPGYRAQGQSLNYYEKKPYDIISIVLEDGTKKAIYFDISNFFGK